MKISHEEPAVKYLLDVNALVALGFADHVFHDRVARWVRVQESPSLLTCSITELGFIRVLAQAPAYGLTTVQARDLLLRLKAAASLILIADDHDASHLPAWVKTPKQLTDGHLAELSGANGGVLATLDARIPGAYVIPER
jgi:predicted nucleic acid-binding protein